MDVLLAGLIGLCARVYLDDIEPSELLDFSFIFLVTWFAFIQLFYRLWVHVAGFSTRLKSMQTGFKMLLGS
jgi:hypothetical protein